MITGSYTGNGDDDRNINVGIDCTSATYKYMVIKKEGLTVAIHKFGHETGDLTDLYTASNQQANLVKAWTSTGFQVGSSNYSNQNGVIYNYVIWYQI